jgi:DNA repair protein RadC
MSRRSPGALEGRLGALAAADRPREKLLARGPEALSDEELVAVLLGTGSKGRPVLESARALLESAGGLHGLWSRGGNDLLVRTSGVGPAKAARLLAVLEIASRLHRDGLHRRDVISDPEAAAKYLMTKLVAETREVMGALLLDAKNRLVEDAVVFRGTQTFSSVSPQPLFRQAILAAATGLVLYHNHPSGDPEPSADDRATTVRFAAAGREIGIEVRDHLVIGRGRWISFHQRGLL